jgi:hypothetical protein
MQFFLKYPESDQTMQVFVAGNAAERAIEAELVLQWYFSRTR